MSAPIPRSCAAGLSLGGELRVAITAASAGQLLADLERRLACGQGFSVATLNLDHVVKLRRSAPFRRAYAAMTHVTADGRPIVWLSRISGWPVGLATGSDLIAPVCTTAARLEVPVALFGASAATLAAAEAALAAAHPGLRVVLRLAPSIGFDPEGQEAAEAAVRIADSGARVCLVALGAPKQELFVALAAQRAPKCGFLAIGAGLDFVAGSQRRAPVWVRALAMEWMWRLLNDPGRLAGRYAACALVLPGLLVEALRMRFRHAMQHRPTSTDPVARSDARHDPGHVAHAVPRDPGDGDPLLTACFFPNGQPAIADGQREASDGSRSQA